MRRMFNERSRVVVYVEAEDVTRMTAQAKSEGKTLVEWARETLLGELSDNSEMRPVGNVPVARKRAGVSKRALGGEGVGGSVPAPVLERPASQGKSCQHGTPAGWRCWQCGGKAIIA
jgi:hypothetical protein